MSETGIYNICYNLEYHCQLLLLKTMAYQYWHAMYKITHHFVSLSVWFLYSAQLS